MNNQIATVDNTVLRSLVLNGDLSKMTEDQKLIYYKQFCDSLGLNPLTEPFKILKLQGKEKLYATKDAAEQLRKVNMISITDLVTETDGAVFKVTAKAKDKDGKTDVSTGVVSIQGLSGENLANAMMKAETKAKRRVTLSICGLGMLDETEVQDIPNAVVVEPTRRKLTDKAFASLLAKLEAKDADIDGIVKSTMETLTLTDDQAEKFAAKVAELQTPTV